MTTQLSHPHRQRGGIIGFFVPTWFRRPEIMVSAYKHFKVIVTIQTKPDGGAVATIDVFPPRSPGALKPSAVRLPDEIEDASADDAIAEAIRTARAWIDKTGNNGATARGSTAAGSNSFA